MQGNDPPFPLPKTITPYDLCQQQPQPHPGMIHVPPIACQVEQQQRQEKQEVERLRGGCCLCPGGNVWVCSTGVKEDLEAEKAQEAKQISDSEAAKSQPLRPLPAFELSSHSSELSSSIQSHMSGKGGQLKPPEQSPTWHSRVVDLPPPPQARLDTRATTRTLPPRARPNPHLHQRQGPRVPVQSLPTRPHATR